MAERTSPSLGGLVLVPGLITLGVTVLRLVGELQHWSNLLFNPSAGGGGAIVGIVWLAPVFGIYFALKLAGAGERPAGLGKATAFTFLGLVLMVGAGALFAFSKFASVAMLIGGSILFLAAFLVPLYGWPQFTKALIAYGYLARVPVVVVMYFAMRGNWGTHYDGAPPGMPEMGFWAKYLVLGLIPQLLLWVAFTVIIGSLLGIAVVAITRRGAPAAA